MTLQFEYLADRPQDVPLIIAWWHTTWADRMGDDLDKPAEQLRASLSKTDLPIHIVATIDGEAVGTAALKEQEAAEIFPDYHYWLGSVFVDHAHRGSNIASQLSQQIIELGKQLELPHLYLQTLNLSGGLYTRLGWEPVQQFQFRGEDTLLMLRQL